MASYGLLAVSFTWPLAAHFGDTIPGQEIDTWQTFWHFQWIRDAFLSFQNPYYTNHLFYPEGTTLLFETMSPVNGLLGLPVQLLFGTFVAYNSLVILTFILSGYAMWLLVRYLTRDEIAAYLAGFIFAFAPYRMAQLLNHLHLISTQWLLFYIYFLWRALDFEDKTAGKNLIKFIAGRWRLLGLAAFFLILNIFNDWYYVFFLLIFTGLLAGWRLLFQPGRRRSVLAGVSLAAGGGLLAGLPLIIAMLIRARIEPGLPFPKEVSIEFSADLLSYFTPNVLNPWWGQDVVNWVPVYMRGNPTEKVVFLGYITLLLGGLALWKNFRQGAFWLVVLLTFGILSLGPRLHVNGLLEPTGKDSSIWLPFDLVNQTPLAGFVRIPSRFGVVALIAAAVLAGFGMAWLRIRTGKRTGLALAGLACLLVGLEFWTAPFELADNYVPAVYKEIAQDHTAKAILELPLQHNAWDYPRRMYFATVHGKNILQGYTSRVEADPLPPENMPGVRQILFNDMQPDITYGNSQKAARAFFDYFGLGYIVIDNAPAGSNTLQHLPNILYQLFGDEKVQEWPGDNITSYSIPLRNPAQTLTAPLLVPGANWYKPEKNQSGEYRWLGATGRLLALIPAGGGTGLQLKLEGLAFFRPHTLLLKDDSGREVAQLTVGNQPQLYQSNIFSLPAGENWLNLVSVDGTDSPAALASKDHPNQDTRQLSVLVYKLSLS